MDPQLPPLNVGQDHHVHYDGVNSERTPHSPLDKTPKEVPPHWTDSLKGLKHGESTGGSTESVPGLSTSGGRRRSPALPPLQTQNSYTSASELVGARSPSSGGSGTPKARVNKRYARVHEKHRAGEGEADVWDSSGRSGLSGNNTHSGRTHTSGGGGGGGVNAGNERGDASTTSSSSSYKRRLHVTTLDKIVHRLTVMGVLSFIILVGLLLTFAAESLAVADAFYFTCVTLSTVGYGDMYPVTDVGKVLVMGYAIMGLGIVAAFVTYLSELSTRKANAVVDKLADNMILGSADPYVRLKAVGGGASCFYCGNQDRKTPILKETLHPEWDIDPWRVDLDTFAYGRASGREYLFFQVWDWDMFTPNDLMAELCLPLRDLQVHAAEDIHGGIRSTLTDPLTGTPRMSITYALPEGGVDEVVDHVWVKVDGCADLPIADDPLYMLGTIGGDWKEALIAVVLIVSYALIVGAVYSSIEGWRFFDGFYFSFITFTQIGYGDFYPTTLAGKLLFFPIAFLGLGVNGYVIKAVTEVSITKAMSRLLKPKSIDLSGSISISLDDDEQQWCRCLGPTSSMLLIALICAFTTLTVGAIGSVVTEGMTFADGYYFSTATLLTIGYGDLYPVTDGGKVFIILFSLTGLVVVSAAISVLAQGSLARIADRLSQADIEVDEDQSVSIQLEDERRRGNSWRLAVGVVFVVFYIGLFAGIFLSLEPDISSYLDAVYFCVVTLSTIGYGDISPTTPPSRLTWMVFVLVGVALMSFLIDILEDTAMEMLQRGMQHYYEARVEYDLKKKARAAAVGSGEGGEGDGSANVTEGGTGVRAAIGASLGAAGTKLFGLGGRPSNKVAPHPNESGMVGSGGAVGSGDAPPMTRTQEWIQNGHARSPGGAHYPADLEVESGEGHSSLDSSGDWTGNRRFTPLNNNNRERNEPLSPTARLAKLPGINSGSKNRKTRGGERERVFAEPGRLSADGYDSYSHSSEFLEGRGGVPLPLFDSYSSSQ